MASSTNDAISMLFKFKNDDAETRKVVNDAIKHMQQQISDSPLKLDMDVESLLKQLTHVKIEYDKTGKQIKRIISNIRMQNGQNWTSVLGVKNGDTVSKMGLTYNGSSDKLASKYLTRINQIAKVRNDMNKIKYKDFITDADTKKLAEYDDNLRKLYRDLTMYATEMKSSGRDYTDVFGLGNHKLQDSFNKELQTQQNKERQAEVDAEKKKQQQQNAYVKEYESNQKRILLLQKQLWEEESKASSSSFKNTRESQQYRKLLNGELQKSINLAREQERVANGEPELHARIADAKAKSRSESERLYSSIKAQYSLNKSFFKDMMSGWKEAAARIVNYTVVYRSVWGLIQGFQAGVQTINELNKALTDIQMVTGYNDRQINNLSASYVKLAKEMGATVSQVTDGATEWLRQGKTVEQTTDLIKQSMILSKVGAMESAEATEYLTSTLNGYKMSVSDASRVVDVFSKLDMSAATSSKELAIAFSRTANMASDAGMSFEQLAGYITTVSETTRRSASSVGEAFKTIFARMMNVKVGKLIDDETGENLNDVEKALSTLGIKLRKSPTEWRDASEVLNEIGRNWEKYNDLQKNTIVTAVAGTRQAEILRSAFNNFNKVLGYTDEAYDAAGSSAQKYEVYLDSIEAKQNKLISTFQEIAYQPGFESLYKNILDIATKFGELLNVFASAPETIGMVGVALAGIVAPKVISGTKALLFNYSKFGEALLTVGNTASNAGAQFAKVVWACKDLTDAQKIAIVTQQAFTAEQMKAALVNMGVDESIALEKTALVGLAVEQKAATVTTATLKTATIGLWEVLKVNPLFWVTVAIAAFTALYKVVDHFTTTLEEQKQKVDEISGKISTLQSEYDTLANKTYLTENEKDRLSILKNELEIEKALLDVEKERQGKMLVKNFTGSGKPSGVGLDNKSGTGGTGSPFKKAIADLDEYKRIQSQIVDLEAKISNGSATAKDLETYDDLNDSLAEMQSILNDTYENSIKPILESGEKLPPELIQYVEDLKTALGGASDKTAKELIADYNNLTNIVKGVGKANTFTKEQVDTLIETYGLNESAIKKVGDAYTIEESALNELRIAVGNTAVAQIENEKIKTQAVIDEAGARITALQKEMEAEELAAKAWGKAISNNPNNTTAYGRKDYIGQVDTSKNVKDEYGKKLDEQNKRIHDSVALLGDYQKQLDAIKGDVATIPTSGSDAIASNTPGKDSSASAIDPQDMADAFVKAADAQANLTKFQREGIQRQIKQAERAKDYTKQIELQNELLKNQELEAQQLQEANNKIHSEADRLRKNSPFGEASKGWFDAYGESTSEYINLLESYAGKTDKVSKQQYEAITDLYNNLYKLKQGWNDNTDRVYELQDAIESTKQTVEDLVREQKQLKLEKQIDSLQKKQEKYEKAVEVVTKRIDKEIDALEKQKDALEKANEAKQDAIDLEKYQEALLNAKNNKTNRVYHADMGWQWEADQSAIDQAQEDLDNFNYQQQIDAIEDTIQAWQDYQDKWEQTVDDYVLNRDELYAEQLLGRDWEADILNQRLTKLTDFKDDYIDILNEITEAQDKLNQMNYDEKYGTTSGSHSGGGGGKSTEQMMREQMAQNSQDWFSADSDTKEALEKANNEMGSNLGLHKDSSGKWVDSNGKPAYADGGVNSEPGDAVLHGTALHSETIFNATDSKKLFDFVHSVPDVAQYVADKFLQYMPSSLSNLMYNNNLATATGGGTSLTIQNMTVYADDANDFLNQMKNIVAITGNTK
jgi:TP901 family phage tail tape measure protein